MNSSSTDPSKPSVNPSGQPKIIEAKDRAPINITIGDNLTALTNTSITIHCPISGVPLPTVTWTKDGQEISSVGRYKVNDDGSLTISEAEEQDDGQYTCTADSVAGKDNKSSMVQVIGKLIFIESKRWYVKNIDCVGYQTKSNNLLSSKDGKLTFL